ncbi:MAG: glycosyltransferase [Planctomycetaceae bacterium]
MHQALGEWPIRFNDDVARTTSDEPLISAVIATGGLERYPQLELTIASLRAQTDVSFEIIVVELGTESVLDNRLPKDVRHMFVETDIGSDGFNKSWALNVGARSARGQYLAIHDGDYLVPTRYLAHCAELLQTFDGVRPARLIGYLDETSLHRCRDLRALDDQSTFENLVANNPTPIVFRTERYWDIGGHDESFFGWGGEDVEFLSRARTCSFSDGGMIPIVHAWHPPAPKKASGHRNNDLQAALMSQPSADRIQALKSLTLGGNSPQPRVIW